MTGLSPIQPLFYNVENGNYYNWCAATAGTCSNATQQYDNAPSSICPKGWRLPTGGKPDSTNQFYTLFGNIGSYIGGTSASTAFQKTQASPYLFRTAAFVDSSGSLGSVGSYGEYWSSTASASSGDNEQSYNLHFQNISFDPGTASSYRYRGYSVRCVAQP